MKTRVIYRTAIGLALAAGFAAQPAAADGVMTTHRISAASAAEAVATAVSTCAAQGFHVSSSLVDADGLLQAFLRGDNAGITGQNMSLDKAYTALAYRTPTSKLVNDVNKGAPPMPGINKLPHLVLAPGGVPIVSADGKEVLGAISVSGVPNAQGDEACAKAGLAKIADQLK